MGTTLKPVLENVHTVLAHVARSITARAYPVNRYVISVIAAKRNAGVVTVREV